MILTAALTILESEGSIEAVTLRKTAKLLGQSYTALYRYFNNKADLVVALRTRAYRRMEETLLASQEDQQSSLENLHALTQAYIDRGLKRPALYRLMFFEFEDEENSQYFDALIDAKRDCLNVCTQVVTEAQEDGSLRRNIDPLTGAHIFWTNAHGLVSLEIGNQLVMGRKINILRDVIIQNVLIGLNNMKTGL